MKLAKETEIMLPTPEGIALPVRVADVGDRAAALLWDLLRIVLLQLVVVVVFGLLLGDATLPLAIVLSFLLTNFYFAYYELKWQGMTPGKRRLGLRVVDRHGGALAPMAVLVRNLMRELELWTPLRLWLAGDALWPDAPVWVGPATLGWSVSLVCLPLALRERQRLGDLLGGTIVIRAAKVVLLPELGAAASGNYQFTDGQLDVYGEFELQTLEQLLRADYVIDRDEALAAVAAKIQGKLRYAPVPAAASEAFLRAFYVALRGRLERRRAFGRRKADKHASAS